MKSHSLRCLTLILCVAALLTCFSGLLAYAKDGEDGEEKLKYEVFESEPPKLTYHNLRYHGGFVTRLLGTFERWEFEKPLYEGVEDSNVVIKSHSPSPMYEATVVFCCLIAYILGSFNFATFISGRKYKDDVRNHGSGNAGMTNMLRTYGKKAALLTLLGDAGKAALAVLIGILLAGDVAGYCAGLFCIFGHAFPIFYRFKGGKGVACTAAVVLMLEPVVFLFLFLIFVLVFLLTKYISLASIMAMLFYPVILSRFYAVGHRDMIGSELALPLHVAIISIMIACFVIFLHRSNIKRLYNKEERKTELFKKKKKENT